MPFCKFVQTYKMQRLLLIIFASFFFCISCRKSTAEGILPTDKLVDLLVEVHLVDGYLNGLQIDSSRRVIDDLYGKVFAKNGIDSVVFKQNMDYYLGNPTMAKEIYAQVSKRLTDMERSYIVEDSIQNAIVTDSLMRAQHYTRLKDEAHRLILDVPKGVLPLDYKNAADDFIKRTGLSLNIYGQNIPLQEIVVKPSSEEPQQEPEWTDSLSKEVEAVPLDTVPARKNRPLRPSQAVGR